MRIKKGIFDVLGSQKGSTNNQSGYSSQRSDPDPNSSINKHYPNTRSHVSNVKNIQDNHKSGIASINYKQSQIEFSQRKFQRNYLRNLNIMTKNYIIKNRTAIARQKAWIMRNRCSSFQLNSNQQIYSKFVKWVKRLNLISAVKFRQNLGNVGKRPQQSDLYFQKLYKHEAYIFYVRHAQIYIIHHRFAANQHTSRKTQVQIRQQKEKYIKNLWKLLWIIKNVQNFQSLKKIKQ